jgi:hypothetical protein
VHIIVFSNKNYLVEFLAHQTQYSLKHYKLLEEFDAATFIENTHVVIIEQDQISAEILNLLNQFSKSKIVLLANALNAIELKSHEHYLFNKPIDLNKLLLLLQEFSISLHHQEGCCLSSELTLSLKHKKLIHNSDNIEINLTEKEVAILHYLYRHKENYISKNELLKAVWHYNDTLDTHTVETHIYRLRQKLGKYANIILSDEHKKGYTLGE